MSDRDLTRRLARAEAAVRAARLRGQVAPDDPALAWLRAVAALFAPGPDDRGDRFRTVVYHLVGAYPPDHPEMALACQPDEDKETTDEHP